LNETGVVKFACEHRARTLPPLAELDALNEGRRELRRRGWIGVDANGIGFGNVSVRDGDSDCFYISGTGTGRLEELTSDHFARVSAFDFRRNWIRCEGLVVASSESLTHAAVYVSAPNVRAVIHCHSGPLWRRLLDVAPTTSAAAEYGTPAMAAEVQRLFRETDVLQHRFFVMAGHEDGVVAFGASNADAMAALALA
jgi:ribulose-5-phosphate 4-epimerase/fuculose-1-phosphate aldolase